MLGIFFILALVFAFMLRRREMIHRHLAQRLSSQQSVVFAEPLETDAAPALALELPEPHRLYALALLCRLQDAQTSAHDARTAFLVRQARYDYLPSTLRFYLNVTPAGRQSLAAQGQNAETVLQEQLELISRGIGGALGSAQADQQLLTQGAFLKNVFQPQQEEIRV